MGCSIARVTELSKMRPGTKGGRHSSNEWKDWMEWHTTLENAWAWQGRHATGGGGDLTMGV